MRAWNRSSGLWAWAVTALLAAASLPGFVHHINPATGLPIKWPPGRIHYQIKLGDASTLTDGRTFNSSVQFAARNWNLVGSVLFDSILLPPGPAEDDNGVNEVSFAPNAFGREFPPGIVAVTVAHSEGNRITEADIILNSNYTWDSYAGNPQPTVEIQRVAIHEFGHALGLGHPDPGVVSIMNSNLVRAPQPDDIQGVRLLYGSDQWPENDRFPTPPFESQYAITLGSNNSAVINAYNTNTTKQPDEPNHASNKGGRSVWWRWPAPAAGRVTLDTRGSYFDTLLAVYTGAAISTLVPVASSDDIDPGVVQASAVAFNVTRGTTYWIAVDGLNADDGYGADCGGIVLNFAFATSEPFAPAIATHPVSATVTAGGSVSFSVSASGSTPLNYQWLQGGTPLAGATSATFDLANATTGQAGTYSVTVSNSAGSVTSKGATLTVNAPPPAPTPAPTSSGGGGGGGGAPSLWFCALLALLGVGRLRR